MSEVGLPSATRPVAPELAELLQRLQPGQRIRVTQTIRVGNRVWTTTSIGAFREVNYLVTGLATHRVPKDEIVVVAVHYTKENGEMTSVTLDEQSKIELLQ